MNPFFLFLFSILIFNYCYAQNSLVEGRGATGRGLWAENTAGISELSQTAIGLAVENRFGLSELTYAQFRVAKPTRFGVVQIHWNNTGDNIYTHNAWGLALARAFSPKFSMAMSGRYKLEKIAQNSAKAMLVDVGMQYDINNKLSAATFLANVFRDSVELSSLSMALQYQSSSKLSLTLHSEKKENLPLVMTVLITYFPIENIGLSSAISSHKTANSFGIVTVWKRLSIDAYISYHQYLGFTPQTALTYSFD